ncbi:MAG: DUF5678 domain-containing protein [Chloroflexota bacterium]
MNASTVTLDQIDPTLRQNAEKIFQALGMTPLEAITYFYKQVELNQELPFPLTLKQSQNGSDNGLEKEQSTHEVSPTDVIDHIELYISPDHDTMAKESAVFAEMQTQLQQQYPNQYVLIHNGEVVDHDVDNIELLKRRKRDYPGRIMLQKHVDSEPNRTITVRSPKLVIS